MQSSGLSQDNLSGCLTAYPLSPPRYLCGSRHSINTDAMAANPMLKEGKQGLPAVADPIRSRNVMEHCPAEFSAVWAYNPFQEVWIDRVTVSELSGDSLRRIFRLQMFQSAYKAPCSLAT
jgi:hypothetical protein